MTLFTSFEMSEIHDYKHLNNKKTPNGQETIYLTDIVKEGQAQKLALNLTFKELLRY